MSNTGIVLTDAGVVIVDSGGSGPVARAILAELRKLTDRPVVAVFNTHVHGDHWLGNAAVREAFPEARIYAHARAIERLSNGEAEHWRGIFRSMTQAEPDPAVLADQALLGGETLAVDGAELRIHHTGHAHTDSDIMVELPDSRVLFTGDIVEHGRAVSSDVPQDFDIAGQIAAIRYALELPVDTFVPGHGGAGGREIPEAALRFLEVLHAGVQRGYEAGLQDYEMRDAVAADLSEFSGWFGFEELGRLISFVYRQVEAAEFQ
jgi:glyoxylase-like metal-dependent hydrolase (beta-lactamase superfamily II)